MRLTWLLRALLLSALSWSAAAEVAVVVHPGNQTALTKEDVTHLFLGKRKTFPDGDYAKVMAQGAGCEAYRQFNMSLLGKNNMEYKSYWSQRIFAGKGRPPVELKNDEAVIAAISQQIDAIGYVKTESVDHRVKVLFYLP